MNNLLRILFVEDLPSDVDLAVLELRKEKLVFTYISVCTRIDLREALKNFNPDLIISDYMMPAYNGMQALMDVKEFDDKIPFILFTGSINEETAVKCIKAGADDYVIKEHMTRLPFAVKEALEQAIVKREKSVAESLLKDSEERFQNLYNEAVAGLYRTNHQGEILLANNALVKMIGFHSFKELSEINLNKAGIGTTFNRQQFIDQIEKYGEIKNLETIWVTREGKEIFVKESAKAIYDPEGKILYYDGSVEDITEKKNAENELKSSFSILNAALESTADGILVVDGKGKILIWNQKFSEMWGLSDVILDKHDDNLAINHILNSLAYPDKFLATIKQLYSDTEKLSFDILEFKDGRIFERYSLPQRIDNKVVGRVWSFRDVTQQRALQEATIASEQRYRDLFMYNPFPTYIFDADSLEFIEVNDATVKNYGYSREEFAAMTLKDLRLPEDISGLIETVKHLGNKPAHSTNMRHKRKDGSVFPVENTSYVLPEKNGRKTRLSMTLDITERVKAAEQMQLAMDKAEASDKLKTTFLNNISHEVRTPLNGILGFAEILSQIDLTEIEKKESLSMLHDSCDRLLNTITSYMDISLLTSGSLSLNKKEFFPEIVLRKIFDVFEKRCLEKNLKLLLHIPENSIKLKINSDSEIFQKILIHLLNNAFKFTEKGSISFGYTVQDSNIEFYVKDTGIGIGKDSGISIFDHFVKEDRGPSKVTEGSGLGLSIAKGMIGIMGGTIRVESEIDKGSSFFFIIPISEISEKLSSDILVVEHENVKIGATILVAEDDDANFHYINAVLTREIGGKVLHAENGREAVELYKTHPDIVLILMDIKMPLMNGIEATRLIKLINKDVPVIAITAYAMLGDESRIIDAGCDGYLSKPINRKMLMEKVAEFIKV